MALSTRTPTKRTANLQKECMDTQGPVCAMLPLGSMDWSRLFRVLQPSGSYSPLRLEVYDSWTSKRTQNTKTFSPKLREYSPLV